MQKKYNRMPQFPVIMMSVSVFTQNTNDILTLISKRQKHAFLSSIILSPIHSLDLCLSSIHAQ